MTSISKQIKLDYSAINNIINNKTWNRDTNIIKNGVTLVMDSSLHKKNIQLKQYYKIQNPQIALVTEGNCLYEIGLEEVLLQKGNIAILPIGTLFCIKSRSDNFKIRLLDFNIPEAEQPSIFIYSQSVIGLSDKDFQRIDKYFLLIHENLISGMPLNYSLKHIVLALMFDIKTINDQINRNIIQNISKTEKIYYQFMHLLMKEYDVFPRKLDYYANALSVSVDYLSNIVRKISKTPVSQWINRLSLSQAKYLLKSTDASLNEIAKKVGFKDQTSFNRFFKKETGVTPLQYRNN